MGIRMPGVSGTIDGKLVEKLIQAERIPVDNVKNAKKTSLPKRRKLASFNRR